MLKTCSQPLSNNTVLQRLLNNTVLLPAVTMLHTATIPLSVSMSLITLGTSYKSNHTVFVLLTGLLHLA